MAIDHVPAPETGDDDYDFQFLTPEEAKHKPQMLPLTQIINLNSDTKAEFAEELAMRLVPTNGDEGELQKAQTEKRKKIEKNIDRFVERFNIQLVLLLQEVSPHQTYDNVLEIFERVNSGGMVLSKSDLLFSTLKLKLKEKEAEFRLTLTSINHGSRYAFDTDFIIKTSLVVFGKGAKYDVRKLRDDDYIEKLKKHYVVLDKCLRQLIVWLDETALIKCDRFLPSKLALIPLIDYMMLSGRHEKPDGPNSRTMKQYLYMAFFTRLFGRSGDSVLDKIHKQLVQSNASAGSKPESDHFPLDQFKLTIKEKIKSDYGLHNHFFADDPDLMLNIVQGGVLQIDPQDQTKHPKDLRLEVDHIFPRSKLQNAGMGDIADNLGNYRLVVLPINRHKLAHWPDASTDFIGKDDEVIAHAYANAISNFNRDGYLSFAYSRAALIQSKVGHFLDLKPIIT